MDDSDFLESLKTDEDRFNDQVQSAEHFVRLKKQSGYQPSETEKKAVHPAIAAGIGGAAAGGAMGYENRDPRRAAIGALIGGASGAAIGALGNRKSSETEKKAGMGESLKSIGPLAGMLMAGGAAIGGAGTYMASKPQEHLGGKSRAEDELEGQVKAHKERPEEGLLHKMKNRTTEMTHGYAQAFRDHPGKASIIGAGAGAAGGLGLARLLDAVRKVPR